MGRISVPVEDLSETTKELQHVSTLIEDTARLAKVGGREIVGDDSLAEAIDHFDRAWYAGHERVKDNVEKFADNVKTVVENFQQTDHDADKALEDSGKDA